MNRTYLHPSLSAVITVLVAMTAVLLLIPPVRAQVPVPGDNGLLLTAWGTPTVDGIRSPGEWDHAARWSFPAGVPSIDGGGTVPATLWVMNDGVNLYAAVEADGLTTTNGIQPTFQFDNDNDGIFPEPGDDVFHSFVSDFQDPIYIDSFYLHCPGQSPTDVPHCYAVDNFDQWEGAPPPGTQDIYSAATFGNGAAFIEISHPLDSADDLHDISVRPGDTVGFLFDLILVHFDLQTYETEQADTFLSGQILVAAFAEDETPPEVTVPVNLIVDATEPGGAVVTFAVTAADGRDGPVPVTCTPASGSLFPIGVTTVGCSASDTAGNTAAATFTVTVMGADGQLGDLATRITEMSLPKGTETRLLSSLRNIRALLARETPGSSRGACGMLNALLNDIRAQSGKGLSVGQADALRETLTRVGVVLNCR